MRKKVIAGNWKMNKLASECGEFLNSILTEINTDDKDVIICPTYVSLPSVINITKGTNVKTGAQNAHYETSGAYTGEVSCEMLKDIGCEYVIIGHSERRKYFAETDETVSLKVKKAYETGLVPIMCIGESLEEREEGKAFDVLSAQITNALRPLDIDEKLIVAYEPIWAIGTGKTATDEQAQEACAFVRKTLNTLFGDVSEKIRVLYGGSVNAKNISSLMQMPDIDGALVGGASLKTEFIQLVNYDK
ncbi:MAG: triose-phosphate isomerase [Anaerofustis stercorihominis]|nr:triose-phosphate isomerase [Anaerofustis stercorihominis]